MPNRRARAKRAEEKSARVGANGRKQLAEQRAKRPRVIAAALKRASKAAAAITLAAAAGYAVFAYGPAVSANITDAARSGKRLPANVKIVNGGRLASARLKSALDSLILADPRGFDRAGALNAAASIPEIEKISVRKIKDRKSREVSTLVKITERRPAAIVHCGKMTLVDKRGIRFAAIPGRFYELPLLIVGDNAADTVNMDVFNRIGKTSKGLGGDFFSQISQIDISGDSTVNLYFKSGEAEYVMGYDDIEERLVHVKKLRERLLRELGEPARIDLRYRGLAFASAM